MDRAGRIRVLMGLLIIFSVALGVQAITAHSADSPQTGDDVYPGRTLVTVQSYGWFDNNNGQALIVNQTGDVEWRFDPPETRVFDAEWLGNHTVLISMATAVSDAECPNQYANGGCVQNRVVEVDTQTSEIGWEYSWYDAFITHHEVHDADRLETGETAIIDMGNNRAFTVNRSGVITWQWNATKHIGPNSSFWTEYVPADQESEFRPGSPESDWTHMNDIDWLPDGTVQLSIRNFDVVVRVDPQRNEIVHVLGEPGNSSFINNQHNPHYLSEAGTVLIADSENNRIIEYTTTGTEVWSYNAGGNLQWPRDADRLPNGNTLIVDSRNFRILEVTPTGETVWRFSLQQERGIIYEADRLGIPEEPHDAPRGGGEIAADRPLLETVREIESWASFVFPPWVGFPELLTILGILITGSGLIIELVRQRRNGTLTIGD